MSSARLALAASLPLLMSALWVYEGAAVVFGSMSTYSLRGDPVRLSQDFVGHVNDAKDFWFGVGLVSIGVLGIVGTLCLTRAAGRGTHASRQGHR